MRTKSNKRHAYGSEPRLDWKGLSDSFSQGLDTPRLKIDGALVNKPSSRRTPNHIAFRCELRPSDRAEEPDSVILSAISLEIVRNEFFALSCLCIPFEAFFPSLE